MRRGNGPGAVRRSGVVTRATGSSIGGAIAGATVGALIAGLSEAALVAVERHLGLDPSLAFFALLFYGVAGVIAGVAIAAVLAVGARATARPPTSAGAFALSGAVVLAVLVTIIGRFRVFRDVFNETFDGAPISPMTFQLASLAFAVILFAAAFFALRALGRRQPLATSPLVVVGALAVALLGSGVLMRGASAPHSKRRVAVSEVVPEGPSVILIMVDTLRADHLSSYGYKAIATPAIDAPCRRRHAFRAYLLAGVLDASLGRDDSHLALSVVASGGAQVRHPAQRRRHPARGVAGVGLPHHRLRRQHQRRAALQLPAGLRRVRLPRARVLLRRDRGGGAADALQPAAPDPRALFRAHDAGRELLSARRGGDDARTRLDRAQRRRAPVLHVPALHGAA